MARTLDQVLSELDSVYNPQIDSIRQRQSAIPDQLKSEEQGLAAQQTEAYGEILNGARRRGLGFSGIPVGEQAKYNATQYMPALARLRQSGREQAMTLEDAILGIQERRRTQGQSIFENERAFAEQQRQFDAQLAESRRQAAAQAAQMAQMTLDYQQQNQQPEAPAAPVSNGAYSFKNGKDGSGGFNFNDAYGNAISAAQYAAANKINFLDLIRKMAASGDVYARNALNSATGPGVIDKNKYYWLYNARAPKKGGGGGGGGW